MRSANQENRPAQYVIRIKNHLDTHWERWFEGMTITHADDGVMILSGEVVDQSALFGILERIHNLNLTLLSFQKIDPVINPNPR
jgi:hypothetical protein